MDLILRLYGARVTFSFISLERHREEGFIADLGMIPLFSFSKSTKKGTYS